MAAAERAGQELADERARGAAAQRRVTALTAALRAVAGRHRGEVSALREGLEALKEGVRGVQVGGPSLTSLSPSNLSPSPLSLLLPSLVQVGTDKGMDRPLGDTHSHTLLTPFHAHAPIHVHASLRTPCVTCVTCVTSALVLCECVNV